MDSGKVDDKKWRIRDYKGMKFKFYFFIFLPLLAHTQNPPSLPSQNERVEMFKGMVSEINRLDGEGLIPRTNRPESWQVTTDKLAKEAESAKTLFELAKVYKRLDATYPNLHARIFFHKDFDREKSEGKVKFTFRIQPDLAKKDQEHYKYFILKERDDKSDLQNGDQILKINSVPIAEIENENFLFCKFPLKDQCALDLHDNFRREILFWDRTKQLTLTVLRNNLEQEVKVTPTIDLSGNVKGSEQFLTCEEYENRYPDFDLEYKGYNLCAYTSKKIPNKIVLRIQSFVYSDDATIRNLSNEVSFFWINYWKRNSSKFNEIIFDVIDNHGGESPIPYYGLFTQKPYQEQFSQFRKIKEFERKDIFESNFWGEKSKEIWLENLKKEGVFEKTKEGEFLPTVPQFCAIQDKDCREGLFQPVKHKFSGRIKILINRWCVSSCVGFTDNMAKLFKGKVKIYGHADSADSAYSRLTIAQTIENSKIKTEILPLKKARKPDTPEPWIRQVVSVTRSTDARGNIISGKVQNVDFWITQKWSESDDDWSKKVFLEALKR